MTETTPAARVVNIESMTKRWAADERSRAWAPSGEADAASLHGRPISHRGLDGFQRPTPALTPAQRLHLDVFGYVVIENVLTPGEVEQLRTDIYDIEQRFRAGDDLRALRPGYVFSEREDNFQIANLPHIGPSFFDYLTHPRIVGMAEEAIGGAARLVASHAHIRRPLADPHSRPMADTFHHGSSGMAGTIANGLYHFHYVHALTNLTDLGPDDGGTMLIPGTHKILGEELKPRWLDNKQGIVEAAMADPSLIHHVEAPAGSTLLFFESLIHASGTIRSGRDRVLVIGAYTPHMFAANAGYEPAAELVRRLPEEYQQFFTGFYSYAWPNLTASGSLTDHPSA